MYVVMLYFILGLAYINANLVKSVTIFHASARLSHETFLACERGELKEYRIRKRNELTRRNSIR
jgi:hypothetical protein